MKIYLASRYSRIAEMRSVAAVLRDLGHEITSRWILGDHQIRDTELNAAASAKRELFAQEDFDDLVEADCTVSFSEEPRTPTRGGRHVEFGIALARMQVVVLIGQREHVFHCLPMVRQFDDFASSLTYFTTMGVLL